MNLLTSSQSQRGFHVSLPFFAVASFLWVFVAVVVVAALRIYCLRQTVLLLFLLLLLYRRFMYINLIVFGSIALTMFATMWELFGSLPKSFDLYALNS